MCGHRAVIVDVTERALDARVDGDSEPYGVLVRKKTLHILEPRRTFASGLLRSATVLEETVTDVAPFTEPAVGSPSAHWINKGGNRFPFHLILEDSRGHSIAVTGPLIFVEGKQDFYRLKPIIDAYNAALLTERQFIADGSAFTFTEQTGDDVTTATLLTQHLTLKAIQPSPPPPPTPPPPVGQDPGFAPAILAATVIVPSIQHLTDPQQTPEPLTILVREPAVTPASLSCFADLALPAGPQDTIFRKTVRPIALPTDKSGGMAAPHLWVAALALETGPVLGNDTGSEIKTAETPAGTGPLDRNLRCRT